MPALTRRRCPEARDECTIAKRTGVPHDEDPWGWSCGFYPGSHPGECTNGSAATFDQARADFEAAAIFNCATCHQLFRISSNGTSH